MCTGMDYIIIDCLPHTQFPWLHATICPNSIKVLDCRHSGSFFNVIEGIKPVIEKTKHIGRRSVIALPLAGLPSEAVDQIIEEAMKETLSL